MSTWTEFSDSIPNELYDKIIQEGKHTYKVEGPWWPINTEEPKMNKYEITHIKPDGNPEIVTIEAAGINLSEGVLVVVGDGGHAKAFFQNWSHVQEI